MTGAHQLAIYKDGREVALGSTDREPSLMVRVRLGAETSGLQIQCIINPTRAGKLFRQR